MNVPKQSIFQNSATVKLSSVSLGVVCILYFFLRPPQMLAQTYGRTDRQNFDQIWMVWNDESYYNLVCTSFMCVYIIRVKHNQNIIR